MVYQLLKKAVENHTKQICAQVSLKGLRISKIFLYMLLDHPDYFWTKGDCLVRKEHAGGKAFTCITIIYLFDEKKSKVLTDKVQDALENLCAYIASETLYRSMSSEQDCQKRQRRKNCPFGRS